MHGSVTAPPSLLPMPSLPPSIHPSPSPFRISLSPSLAHSLLPPLSLLPPPSSIRRLPRSPPSVSPTLPRARALSLSLFLCLCPPPSPSFSCRARRSGACVSLLLVSNMCTFTTEACAPLLLNEMRASRPLTRLLHASDTRRNVCQYSSLERDFSSTCLSVHASEQGDSHVC